MEILTFEGFANTMNERPFIYSAIKSGIQLEDGDHVNAWLASLPVAKRQESLRILRQYHADLSDILMTLEQQLEQLGQQRERARNAALVARLYDTRR